MILIIIYDNLVYISNLSNSMTNQFDSLPELLSLKQTSTLLSVSPWTLRNWDNSGKLKAVRMGARRDRRYKKEDIIKILKEGTQ